MILLGSCACLFTQLAKARNSGRRASSLRLMERGAARANTRGMGVRRGSVGSRGYGGPEHEGPQGWLCAGSWLPSPWGRAVGGHEPLLSPGSGQGSLDLQSPAAFHCVPDSSKQGELGSMQTKPAVPACPLPCRPLPGRCPLARSPPRLLQIPLPTERGPQKPGDTRLVQRSGPE
uniref:Uncharacterized protein n=1 Tax=Chrysemys picta bellii TaxID=8478 RepID=A0A8C3FLN3_CHRPI